MLDAQITWPIAWDLNGINRLEDFSKDSQISEETEFIFVEPSAATPESLKERFELSKVQLRDWWVPDKCLGISCVEKYFNYFISRKIWNDKGGYDVDFYKKK